MLTESESEGKFGITNIRIRADGAQSLIRELKQRGRERRRERYKTIIQWTSQYNDSCENATSWSLFPPLL